MTLHDGKTSNKNQIIQHKPWWEKVLDAALNINPFSQTTSVYGILVVLLFGISYTLWNEVHLTHDRQLKREIEFIEYIKKRDTEVIELVTRVDQRLKDQKQLVDDVRRMNEKINKLIDK